MTDENGDDVNDFDENSNSRHVVLLRATKANIQIFQLGYFSNRILFRVVRHLLPEFVKNALSVNFCHRIRLSPSHLSCSLVVGKRIKIVLEDIHALV